MKIRLTYCTLLIVLLAANSFAAPTITVWNGLNQSFGQIGNPQTAINILGNVSDVNGIQSLNYRLNGGSPIALSRGPDTRRLLSTGDFNVDIPTASLNSGSNTVLITATNNLSQQSTATVTVNYASGQHWPLPYSINWAAAGTIPSVAQIVDGNWTLSGGTIHPTSLGYDRLVAIGNKTWTDYEVTVPITINSLDTAGFQSPSNGPGIGLLFRWTGHTDTPFLVAQPKTGYLPLGAIGWYNWDQGPNGAARMNLLGNNLATLQSDNSGFALTFGITYIFKMRVSTIPGVGGEYRMKVWQSGQTEPSTWRLSGTQSLSDPQAGSFCLVSHHVNANFGNVTVDTIPPPVISNIQVVPGGTTATVSWNTDGSSTSIVMYGLTTAYEVDTVSNSSLVTSHAVPLAGLSSSTTYHYKVRSTDARGVTSTSGDQTFTTTTLSNIASDHLNQGSLNTGLWTFVNPKSDATLTMTGSQVSIAVPGGTSHDAWIVNDAPRIMQNVTNSNFEIQVKFDTPVSQTYQLEGVVAEQDANNFIRFDFVSGPGITRIYSATFANGTAVTRINTTIGGSLLTPLYLRVKREGNVWTESYSLNGINWTVAGSFSHTLTMTKIGPFIGNAPGSSSPAFTGLVNYFVRTDDPVKTSLKAFLQGPFSTPGDSMLTNIRSLIPLSQPYNMVPWNHTGTESVGSLPDSVVDWVLLELRTATASSSKVSTSAALIKRDGSIVGTDGAGDVTFAGVAPGNYYVVLRHRNHLPVMTASPLSLGGITSQYDFSNSQSKAYGSAAMVEVTNGVFALPGGDTDASGVINENDISNVFGSLNTFTYHLKDINLSGVVTGADANIVLGNRNRISQVP